MASQHGDARFRESSATDAMPGQRLCGRLARFVHPAESFHYHRRRQSLAGCFAQIQTDAAIGQLEIVKKITTDFGNRLEFVRNPNSTNLQRLSRKPHALNRARLLEFFLASFSTVDCSFQTQRLTGQGIGGQSSLAAEITARRKAGRCFLPHTHHSSALRGGIHCNKIGVMRALALLLVFAGVAFGIYQTSLKKIPASDPGTASTQAISLTGVRSDLLQIAQAERSFTALNDHCASIDELISSNSLTMRRPERDGYSYSVECSGANFTATARHAPAPERSPIRYPALAIDQTMQVRELP
jgi:hypothetical protein